MNELNEAIQRKIRYESALKIASNMPANTLNRWLKKMNEAGRDIELFEKKIIKNLLF